ncbi:hypothetical protein SKAU_G00187100 [Synaphobranchus kaupii]|uniref:Uncharacterized protein n=1 Tax=Synaphobranchus kaupii TaxID=118154 RepID=A0A9Q1IWJ0_SYNKA|nr:hypothetical protein SKAU_G00187100 [Synaphobranchus kaupii]
MIISICDGSAEEFQSTHFRAALRQGNSGARAGSAPHVARDNPLRCTAEPEGKLKCPPGPIASRSRLQSQHLQSAPSAVLSLEA